MELEINMVAILVAVVANFILGFIWYTPLFGKVWGREMGYDPNEKPEVPVEMEETADLDWMSVNVDGHNVVLASVLFDKLVKNEANPLTAAKEAPVVAL